MAANQAQGALEGLQLAGVGLSGLLEKHSVRPADRARHLGPKPELGGEISEPGVVVSALAAGLLDPAHGRHAVRGLMQRRIEQLAGAKLKALTAEEHFRDRILPFTTRHPALTCEVTQLETATAHIATASANDDHRRGDIWMPPADLLPQRLELAHEIRTLGLLHLN